MSRVALAFKIKLKTSHLETPFKIQTIPIKQGYNLQGNNPFSLVCSIQLWGSEKPYKTTIFFYSFDKSASIPNINQ